MKSLRQLQAGRALDAFVDTLAAGTGTAVDGLSPDLAGLVERLWTVGLGAWPAALDQVALVDTYLDQVALDVAPAGLDPVTAQLVSSLASLPSRSWEHPDDQVALADRYLAGVRAGADPAGLDPVISHLVRRVAQLPLAVWQALPSPAELAAVDAYVDALGTGAGVPAALGGVLGRIIDRLAALPASTWAAMPSQAELVALDRFLASPSLDAGAGVDPATARLVRALAALPAASWQGLPSRGELDALDALLDQLPSARADLMAELPAGLGALAGRLSAIPASWWTPAPSVLEVTALDVYLDSLSLAEDDAHAGLDHSLVRLVAALAALPVSAWGDAAAEPVPAAPAEPVPAARPSLRLVRGGGAPGSPRSRRLSKLEAVVGVAAAVLVLAVSAAVGGLGGQAGHAPAPAPSAQGSSVTWRLTSFIRQPAWQDATSPSLGTSSVNVVCATAAHCLAVAWASPVVEVTSDRGATWQAATLPGGQEVTGWASCPTHTGCYVAAATPPGSTGSSSTPYLDSSTDGGLSWASEAIPAASAVTGLACASAGRCVVSVFTEPSAADPFGIPAVEGTSDGGASWSTASLPASFAPWAGSGLDCGAARSCVAVGGDPSGDAAGAAYSVDGGSTWSPASVPAGLGPLMTVSCAGPMCLAVARSTPALPSSTTGGVSPTVLLASSDAGRRWSAASTVGLPAGVRLVAADCQAARRCTVAGSKTDAAGVSTGFVARSEGAGTTWSADPLPTTGGPAASTGGSGQVVVSMVSSVSCPQAGACIALAAQPSVTQTSPDEVVFTSLPAS